jgi:chromosome segregation ATPase
MKELLKLKLKKAEELKNYTLEIVSVSSKSDYMKIQSMLENRQALIDEIDILDKQIRELSLDSSMETSETKDLKRELREMFKEIYEIDNEIRKKLNDELKNVKKNLNKPESPTTLNFKA